MITRIHGDCGLELQKIEGNFFDICVTSPPYDKLRTYNGSPVWDFELIAGQIYRVLKPGGVLCWLVADAIVGGGRTLTSFRQAIHFTDVVGFTFDDDIIWQKIHVPSPCSSRYHQMHEHVFILTKGPKKTFNPIKDRPNKWFGKAPFGKNTKRQANGEFTELKNRKPISEFGKRPNVWTGKSRAQEQPCQRLEHPAMMPKWLTKDLLRSFANQGDNVLDPFAGSGTTGIQADALGMDSWLIEINPDYLPQQPEKDYQPVLFAA